MNDHSRHRLLYKLLKKHDLIASINPHFERYWLRSEEGRTRNVNLIRFTHKRVEFWLLERHNQGTQRRRKKEKKIANSQTPPHRHAEHRRNIQGKKNVYPPNYHHQVHRQDAKLAETMTQRVKIESNGKALTWSQERKIWSSYFSSTRFSSRSRMPRWCSFLLSSLTRFLSTILHQPLFASAFQRDGK